MDSAAIPCKTRRELLEEWRKQNGRIKVSTPRLSSSLRMMNMKNSGGGNIHSAKVTRNYFAGKENNNCLAELVVESPFRKALDTKLEQVRERRTKKRLHKLLHQAKEQWKVSFPKFMRTKSPGHCFFHNSQGI